MAACALACAPLVQVEPAFTTGALQVLPCLNSVLIERFDRRRIMALALTVDASAERAERVKSAVFTQQDALSRIEAACRAFRPGNKPADTLAEVGVLEHVPFLARRLSAATAKHAGQHVQQQQLQLQQLPAGHIAPGAAYLHFVGLINQVVMMSTQLYNDATTPSHHKYAAHQVALLYQSLNMLQGETKPIRRLIEGRFDEIKGITESQQPYLDPELGSWLQGITWLCREEVSVCPGYVHRRLCPLLNAVRQH